MESADTALVHAAQEEMQMLVRVRQVWRAAALVVALTVFAAAGLAGAQDTTPLVRTDAQGGVTIKVVYVTRDYFKANHTDPLAGKIDLDRNVVFAITLDTHAGDLSGYDVVKNITLRDGRGRRLPALRWLPTANGAHHRQGGLLFAKKRTAGETLGAAGETFELTVRNLGGVPQRTLRWTLRP
jgi:hypothetical protein